MTVQWPQKTRELHNHHFDSTAWNRFEPRDDDIIVSTYAKSGTTWVQQILGQLLFGANPELEVANMSPWLDLRVMPPEVHEAVAKAPHRRFLKTHLPVDALVYYPQARYIYIARDPRDVVMSMHNHHFHANDIWYDKLNNTPGRVGPEIERPPEDPRQYFLEWVDGDGHPWWSYWDNVRSWWEIRDLPNLLTLHFSELKADLPGQMRRIADFIDVEIDEAQFDDMVKHCSFAWMKENASKSAPVGGIFWEGGSKRFIHKGTRGQWKDVLTDDDLARYREVALQNVDEALLHWLETGER